MDCIEEGVLQMYLDGEVSAEEKRQIAQHLDHCEACRSKLAEQKALKSSVLSALDLLAESSEVHEEKVQRLPVRKILYAITAASILLIGFAFFKNYNKTQIYQPDIYYELDWSVDANKPITDQEFMINMYNTEEVLPEVIIE